MNRAQLYHNMTTSELKEKMQSLKQELFNLRFQHTTGQLKNPLALDTVKKDIARVMTVLKERETNAPKNTGKQSSASKTKPAIKEVKVEGKKQNNGSKK